MKMFCRYIFYQMFLFFLLSCGKLEFDNSVAYPLIDVVNTPTPAFQEIRQVVQYGDLIYTAAGSSGILTYRIVGDEVRPELKLSVSNLYSVNLEQVFVRTVEILETELVTNLVFAFDTIRGGGVGVAEITPSYTKPLGELIDTPNLRIRNTVTIYNPQGYYDILLADENKGVVTYQLSFISNSFFEQPKIASLIDFISLADINSPVDFFSSLGAPALAIVTNVNQITNLFTLLDLAVDQPEQFAQFITNIPFLSEQQRQQLQQLTQIEDKETLRTIVDSAKNLFDEQTVQDLLKNPQGLAELTNLAIPTGSLSGILSSLVSSPNNQLNPQTINTDTINTGTATSLLVSENPLTLEETETLYSEALLSNKDVLAGKDINTEEVHDPSVNPFTNRSLIGNAAEEIERTIKAVGRRFLGEDVSGVKEQLYDFTQEELRQLFASAFQQANLVSELLPILNDAGVNLEELYTLLREQQFFTVIDVLDSSVLAQILRLLPKFQVQTKFSFIQTNVMVSGIRNMNHDERFLYIASGFNGIYIVDRITGEIVDHKNKDFSDVTMVVPYSLNGKDYYVVTDQLDGLVVYRRKKNYKIGEQVNRVALVGDGFAVLPYGNIFWVADGANGVLGVRMNDDETLVIESETYNKDGIAYGIGSARRREVLASYGADGLKRLRMTNVLTKAEGQDSGYSRLDSVQRQETEDLIDKMLNWSRLSPIALFLREVFL